MTHSQLGKLIAELRFMGINLPDIYERVTLDDGNITGIDFDSVNLAHFPHFPVTIEKLPHLKRLSLRYNQLEELPVELENSTNLEFLDLGRNELKAVPEFLVNYPNLLELRLNHNLIKDDNLKNLPTSLERLHIGNNKLTKLPELKVSENLQSLSLPSNKLTEIDFTELPDKLRFINLRSNQIQRVEFQEAGNLEKINLYNNPVEVDNSSLNHFGGRIYLDHRSFIDHEKVKILSNRLQDLRFLPNYPPQFGLFYQGIPFTSIMLFGDKYCGKQTFIEYYLKNDLIPSSKLVITQNRYMNWDHYIFRQHNRNFQVWYPYRQDYLDQEYRRGILNGFYYAGIILLFFDLNDLNTFDTIIRSIEQINSFRSNNIPIFVIGNKADLTANKGKTPEIEEELEAIRDNTRRELEYFEVSSVTGMNVDKVFESIYRLFNY